MSLNKHTTDLKNQICNSLSTEIKNLIDYDINFYDETEDTILHKIAYHYEDLNIEEIITMIKTLLNKGVDINAVNNNGCTPLHYAVMYTYDTVNCFNYFNLLLENGADINIKNKFGNTPLHNNPGYEIFNFLIQKINDINTQNEKGETLLHIITYNFQDFEIDDVIKMIETLLNRGANINAKNYNDETILHYALKSVIEIKEEQINIVNYLLKKGVNII